MCLDLMCSQYVSRLKHIKRISRNNFFNYASSPEGYGQLVVGDKVILDKNYEICDYLPRETILTRIRGDNTRISIAQKKLHLIAVNIEIAIIVASVTEPVFTPGLIDRYLIICQYSGIRPLICLNKCDLTMLRHPIIKYYKEALGIEIVETSVNNGSGIQQLKTAIKNKLVAFVGASGVGKSSIISALSGKQLKTQTVSCKCKKGMHTTTSSNLYQLFHKTYVIDTPGVRNLDVSNVNLKNLKDYFPEFKSFEYQCKYKNCLHYNEPNCAIKDAQDCNKVYKMRYQSYLRIFSSLID